MGLFDRMFGKRASDVLNLPDAQRRFDELKQKYQTALNLADRENIEFQNLHVQDDKLYVKGVAPTQEVKDKFEEQLRLVNPSGDDVIAEISVAESRAAAAAAGAATSTPQVTYTVQAGDTLSKISREYYGNDNEYMRIFYANRDKLKDPDKIQVGQTLVIPPDDNG
jgi:LysM repeat protein